jgi:transposase-like protein
MTARADWKMRRQRQIVQAYLAKEILHSLGRRHNLARNLIRIWIQTFEAGAFNGEPPQPTRSKPTRPGSPPGSHMTLPIEASAPKPNCVLQK